MRRPAGSTLELPAFPPPLDLAVFRRMADMSNEAFFLTDASAHLRYCLLYTSPSPRDS